MTDDENIAKLCNMIRNYGQENRYEHKIFGMNSRLDEIQAAILSVQLKHIDEMTQTRIAIASKYQEALQECPLIQLPAIQPNTKHVFHLYVIQAQQRDTLKDFLETKGIQTLIHYPIPIHRQQLFGHKYDDIYLPVTEQKVATILSLPIHPFLTDTEVDYICSSIKEFHHEI